MGLSQLCQACFLGLAEGPLPGGARRSGSPWRHVVSAAGLADNNAPRPYGGRPWLVIILGLRWVVSLIARIFSELFFERRCAAQRAAPRATADFPLSRPSAALSCDSSSPSRVGKIPTLGLVGA